MKTVCVTARTAEQASLLAVGQRPCCLWGWGLYSRAFPTVQSGERRRPNACPRAGTGHPSQSKRASSLLGVFCGQIQ